MQSLVIPLFAQVVLQALNKESPDAILRLLRSKRLRARAAAAVVNYAKRANFDGLSMDVEKIPRGNATFHGLLATWLREDVVPAAAKAQLTVASTVAFDLGTSVGVDVAALAAASSSGGLTLMAYDYHWGCNDLHAGPSSTRILGDIQGSSLDSNETFCVLNHQRRLPLPRPTAVPTATQSPRIVNTPLSAAAGPVAPFIGNEGTCAETRGCNVNHSVYEVRPKPLALGGAHSQCHS